MAPCKVCGINEHTSLFHVSCVGVHRQTWTCALRQEDPAMLQLLLHQSAKCQDYRCAHHIRFKIFLSGILISKKGESYLLWCREHLVLRMWSWDSLKVEMMDVYYVRWWLWQVLSDMARIAFYEVRWLWPRPVPLCLSDNWCNLKKIFLIYGLAQIFPT